MTLHRLTTFSPELNRSRHNCDKSYGKKKNHFFSAAHLVIRVIKVMVKKLSLDFLKGLGISLKIQLSCLAVLYKYDWKIFCDASEGLHDIIVGP